MPRRPSNAKAGRLISELAAHKAASPIGSIYPLPWKVVAAIFTHKTRQTITTGAARKTGTQAMAKMRSRAKNQVVVFFE